MAEATRPDSVQARVPDESMLRELMGHFPRVGRVEWIGVRPGRKEPLEVLEEVEAVVGSGLAGDHFEPRPGGSGRRQVTTIQAEHLPVIAALAGVESVDPADLRRNLVISGINLQALKGRRVQVGEAVLQMTTSTDPCSRMEAALGEGGFNAMRGMGGWNAEVIEPGTIRVGDEVRDLGLR